MAFKFKLTTQEKADFRHARAHFEGTLEFFADLNVAVAVPESGTDLDEDTAEVAFFAAKTPMSKTYAMRQVLEIAEVRFAQIVTVLRKGRADSEIARKVAEIFSLVEPEPEPEPEPLTVAEIEQMNGQWNYEIHGDRTRYLVRMTEKAHGIKGAV